MRNAHPVSKRKHTSPAIVLYSVQYEGETLHSADCVDEARASIAD